MTTLPSWQVELLKQEVKEKEADFLAQEAQLLEELEASRVTEQQLRASLRALETKAAQVQLRLHSTENQLAALAAEQQPGQQAQAQLASLCSVLQQALGSACENRPELLGGGDSASLGGPEPGKTTQELRPGSLDKEEACGFLGNVAARLRSQTPELIQSEFESPLCHLIDMCAWASHLSFGLDFL